jgi:hypothetical protein
MSKYLFLSLGLDLSLFDLASNEKGNIYHVRLLNRKKVGIIQA